MRTNRFSLLSQAKALLKGMREKKMHVYIVGRDQYPTDVQDQDILIKLIKKEKA